MVRAAVVFIHSVISEAATSTDVPVFNVSLILSSSDEEAEFSPDNNTTDMFM